MPLVETTAAASAKGAAATAFSRFGYAILDLLSPEEHRSFEELIERRLEEVLLQLVPDRKFNFRPLLRYHELGIPDEIHSRAMGPELRHLMLGDSARAALLKPVVLEILDSFWGHRKLVMRDKLGGQWVDRACGFRVVRPGGRDVSGIHSESSYGIFPLTLWIPIAGFDERSTLKLAPASHAVVHPKEAIQKSERFTARPYSDEYVRRFHFLRPAMRRGQVIAFHPNLIHGGSENGTETTRVSMEVRLYQAGETG